MPSSSGPLWDDGEVLAHVPVGAVKHTPGLRVGGKVPVTHDAVVPEWRILVNVAGTNIDNKN